MKVFHSGPCVFSIRFADSRLVLPSLVEQCGTCGFGKAQTYRSGRQAGRQRQMAPSRAHATLVSQPRHWLVPFILHSHCWPCLCAGSAARYFSKNSTCTWSRRMLQSSLDNSQFKYLKRAVQKEVVYFPEADRVWKVLYHLWNICWKRTKLSNVQLDGITFWNHPFLSRFSLTLQLACRSGVEKHADCRSCCEHLFIFFANKFDGQFTFANESGTNETWPCCRLVTCWRTKKLQSSWQRETVRCHASFAETEWEWLTTVAIVVVALWFVAYEPHFWCALGKKNYSLELTLIFNYMKQLSSECFSESLIN